MRAPTRLVTLRPRCPAARRPIARRLKGGRGQWRRPESQRFQEPQGRLKEKHRGAPSGVGLGCRVKPGGTRDWHSHPDRRRNPGTVAAGNDGRHSPSRPQSGRNSSRLRWTGIIAGVEGLCDCSPDMREMHQAWIRHFLPRVGFPGTGRLHHWSPGRATLASCPFRSRPSLDGRTKLRWRSRSCVDPTFAS